MKLVFRLYHAIQDMAIQDMLFPFIEGEYGPLTGKQKQLVRILEIFRIMEFLYRFCPQRGRPLADRKSIAPAFVVKSVYSCPTTKPTAPTTRQLWTRYCLN